MADRRCVGRGEVRFGLGRWDWSPGWVELKAWVFGGVRAIGGLLGRWAWDGWARFVTPCTPCHDLSRLAGALSCSITGDC